MSLRFLTLPLLLTSSVSLATSIHVDASAPAGGDGTSWSLAFNDLESGLAAATNGDDIWVAQGTYYPTTGRSPPIREARRSR